MGVPLHTLSDPTLITELRIRSRCNSIADVAAETGISSSHLYGLLNGNARLGESSRGRILAIFREEELALAARVEAEPHSPPLLKDLG